MTMLLLLLIPLTVAFLMAEWRILDADDRRRKEREDLADAVQRLAELRAFRDTIESLPLVDRVWVGWHLALAWEPAEPGLSANHGRIRQ